MKRPSLLGVLSYLVIIQSFKKWDTKYLDNFLSFFSWTKHLFLVDEILFFVMSDIASSHLRHVFLALDQFKLLAFEASNLFNLYHVEVMLLVLSIFHLKPSQMVRTFAPLGCPNQDGKEEGEWGGGRGGGRGKKEGGDEEGGEEEGGDAASWFPRNSILIETGHTYIDRYIDS